MKKNSILLITSLFVIQGMSQTNTNTINYYFNTELASKKDIIVTAENIVAKYNFAKLKFIIENKSNYYVVFRKNEVKYKNNKTIVNASENKKPVVIRPYKKRSWTINFEGNNNFLVDTFNIIPNGISIFSNNTPINAPKFHLPPNKNQFIVGNFIITMEKIEKETGKVAVKFKCDYLGSKVGIVSPSDAVLIIPNKSEWANVKSDIKPKILFKGNTVNFTLIFEVPGRIVDTQFAELDIDWKTTFRISEEKQLELNEKTITFKEAKN